MEATWTRRDKAFTIAAVVAAPIATVVVLAEWVAVAVLISFAYAEDVSDEPYAFIELQDDGETPVGYDPCRTVRIAINPKHAPDNHRALVDTSIAHIEAATGLDLEVVGTTSSRSFFRQLGRSGATPPVLVAWADEDELSDLEGDVAGVGGSISDRDEDGFWRYQTGTVVLDAELFGEFEDYGEVDEAQAIIDHEFGHVVGLDHVSDTAALMYADQGTALEFAPGDLTGLRILGDVPCERR